MLKTATLSKVTLTHVSAIKSASAVTQLLVYYSDDEGASFKNWVKAELPALFTKFEKEPLAGAHKGVTGESAWFQTDQASICVASLGPTLRKDGLAVRYETERLLKTVMGRGALEVAVHFYGFSRREQMIAAEACVVAGYSYFTTKSDQTPPKPVKVQFASKDLKTEDLERAQVIAHGTIAARELAILPANVATPIGVVERARGWAEGSGLEIEVFGKVECEKRRMGLFLSVASGSHNEPQMLVLKYKPQNAPENAPCLGLVGKGVTFDTGGYNLKTVPYKELIDMKADMGGAAATIGAMLTIAQLKPKVPVIAVCALTDNMISATATHPGDVFTSMAGKTVEIQNTDAEGRLVLSDAITLAKQMGATHLIDIATLTGACVIALGTYYSGLMTNHPDWAAKVTAQANENGEPVWQLPLNFRHADEIKSDVADLSNMGKGRAGGAMIAGTFLKQFVGNTPWVHLDIAGSSDFTPNNGVHGTAKYAGTMASTLAHVALSLD